jgi:hypothetical protein
MRFQHEHDDSRCSYLGSSVPAKVVSFFLSVAPCIVYWQSFSDDCIHGQAYAIIAGVTTRSERLQYLLYGVRSSSTRSRRYCYSVRVHHSDHC